MKKLLLLSALLIFACSSDDSSNNDNNSNQNDFFTNHIGVWKTTIDGSIDYLIDIDNNSVSSYIKFTSDNCYDYSPPTTGSSNVIISNTPDEYIYEITGIPVQNLFSDEDLDFVVNDLGYNYVDIYGEYLHTSQTIISYFEGIYAGNIELLTVIGSLAKQNSSTFNVCRRSFSNEKNFNNYSINEELKNSFK